jgi:hypothetical protein
MIQFVCDTCSALKQTDEAWIVGLAAEAIGAVSARREVNIQSTWTHQAALHPLAVHFCSTQCKDEYLDRLFAPEAPVKEVVVERVVPAEVVVERGVPERRRVVTKARKLRGHKRTA